MEKKNYFLNLKKILRNDLQGGGIYVPMGIFPHINIHKNINCHLKI